MRQVLPLWAAVLLVVMAGCSPEKGRPAPRDGGGSDGSTLPEAPDADGDRISDSWEGRDDPGGAVDTDGDGTPDYLDDDSDGDGIPDSVEGNTTRSGDEPADSDGDGIYDFRDDDSDGNGIPDVTEGGVDTDGDGDPDSRDDDNDGDRISDVVEIGGSAVSPVDSDGDGTPDYMDLDSDGDFIGDLHESTVDTDGDTTPDRLDLDSDEDGWTDAEEAGDMDVGTPPVDSDMDAIPDFRDPDSDNDGLSDIEERAHGTSRTNPDTDGDGVTDLVEIAACPAGDTTCAGDATDGTSSPRTRGDFVFFEPYMLPPDPVRDTLVFATDIRVADVYFLMDTTGSMGGAISSLKSGLSTPGSGLIDRVRAEIDDVWFGVGGFDDYPAGSYGYASSGDKAFYHLQDLTGDTTVAQASVNLLTLHYGGDGSESDVAALWAVATGSGLAGSSGWTGDRSAGYGGFSACAAGFIGWPCFRAGAVPIVVLITDYTFHNGPMGYDAYSDATIGGHAPTYDETVAALTAARIRVIGIEQNTYGGAGAHLRAVATDTGAVDGAGAPLVSTWTSGTISDAVVTQIRTLANQTPLDISIVFDDDPGDAVDTWAAFVDHLEANTVGDVARGCEPRAAEDTTGDGFPDTFRDVTPGSPICFDIVVKQNNTIMSTAMPQIFLATLRVLGDGFTELDSRRIYFLVPPIVEIPGGPD